MAEIDIFNPQESVVAEGTEGKVIMLYGTNNTGKTFQGVRIGSKQAYVMACEMGLNAIAGIKYNKISSWGDFKKVVKQFTSKNTVDKAKAIYSTIVIDEVYASSVFCKDYVCATHGGGALSLGANENSKVNLYQMYEQEYWREINKLVGSGYTVVFIAHKDEKDGYTLPKGDKRCLNPIIDNCDVVCYLTPAGVDEEGKVIKSTAHLAQTNEYFARCRFTKIVTEIPEFTAEKLEAALAEAIRLEADETGIKAVSYAEQLERNTSKKASYEELMEEVTKYGSILAEAGLIEQMTEIVENVLGPGKKVMECTKKQTEAIEIILEDLKELAQESGLVKN